MTQTAPGYWPGTAIIKSQDTPFSWRTPGMDPRPLNAGIQASPKPVNKGGRTGPMAFGAEGGTIKGLTREAKILAARPPHVGFVIPKPSAASRAIRPIANSARGGQP